MKFVGVDHLQKLDTKKMVKKAADRGLIKFSFLEIGRTNRSLFRTQFQMESNQYEMKLHFQTSSFSLNISQLCRQHVYSQCFYDPLNFVSKNISKMLSQSLFKLAHN